MTDSSLDLPMVLEAALLAAGEALSIDRMRQLWPEENQPDEEQLRTALTQLSHDYTNRGIELVEVASGFRLQVRQEFARWVGRLWEERPGQYTRALLETLALVAYRQPITRGEIGDVRGVAVGTPTIKTLLERGWVKIVGHRETPGRPALYGTTRAFLDYFNLATLSELPALAEPRDLAAIGDELFVLSTLEPSSDAGDLGDGPASVGIDQSDHSGDPPTELQVTPRAGSSANELLKRSADSDRSADESNAIKADADLENDN